jgi:hypothetical protein
MSLAVLAQAAQPTGTASSTLVIVLSSITGIGGISGLVALLLVGSQRRKNNSEAAKNSADGATVLTNMAIGMVKPLEERLVVLSDENRDLRIQNTGHERRDVDQEKQIDRQNKEIKRLRNILRRIRDAVTSPVALNDPVTTINVVRELAAVTPDPAATDGS